jgi:GTP-binding protein YchF
MWCAVLMIRIFTMWKLRSIPPEILKLLTWSCPLSDLAQVEKRMERARKNTRVANKEASFEVEVLEKLQQTLDEGKPARLANLNEEELAAIAFLQLLTLKPIIYAANVSEDDLATGNAWVEQVRAIASQENAEVVIVSAQVEAELIELSEADKLEFLESLGVTEGGLRSLIRATYKLLGLRTYFTVGPKEARAWTITAGMSAPQAAGVIHSDFERGFIRAETIAFDDLVATGSMKAAKEKGWCAVRARNIRCRREM